MVTEIHVHQRRSGPGLAAGTAAVSQPGYATGPATGMQYPLIAPTNTAVTAPSAAGVVQPAGTAVVQGGGLSAQPVTAVQGAQAQAPLLGGLGTVAIDATGLGVAAPTATVIPGAVNAGVGVGSGVGSSVPATTIGGTGPVAVSVPAMPAADTTGVGAASTNLPVVPPPPTTAVGGIGTAGVGAMDGGIGMGVGALAQPVATTGTVAGGVGAPIVGGMPVNASSGMAGGYGTGMGAGYGTGLGAAGSGTMGIGNAGIGAGVRPPASQRVAGSLQQLGGYLADDPEMVLRGKARRAGTAPAPLTAQGAAIQGGGGTGRHVPGVGPTYH